MFVCVCACVRACVRARACVVCVRICARACGRERARVLFGSLALCLRTRFVVCSRRFAPVLVISSSGLMLVMISLIVMAC